MSIFNDILIRSDIDLNDIKLDQISMMMALTTTSSSLLFSGNHVVDMNKFESALRITCIYCPWLLGQLEVRGEGKYKEFYVVPCIESEDKKDIRTGFLRCEYEDKSGIEYSKDVEILPIKCHIKMTRVDLAYASPNGLTIGAFKVTQFKNNFTLSYRLNHAFYDQESIVYLLKFISNCYENNNIPTIDIPVFNPRSNLVKSDACFSSDEEFIKSAPKGYSETKFEGNYIHAAKSIQIIFNNKNIEKFKSNSNIKLSTNDIIHAILLKAVNEYKDESIKRDKNTESRLFFCRNMRNSFKLGPHITGDYVRFQEISLKYSDGSFSLQQLAEKNRKALLDTSSVNRFPNECLWLLDFHNRRDGDVNNLFKDCDFLVDKLSTFVTNWSNFSYDEIKFGESRVYEIILENKAWVTPSSSFVRIGFRGIGAKRQIIAVCDTFSQEFIDILKEISAETELFHPRCNHKEKLTSQFSYDNEEELTESLAKIFSDGKDIELIIQESTKEITYDLSSNSSPLNNETSESTSESSNDNKQEKLSVSLTELFSTAEALDYFLIFLGSCGGLITGVSIPFFYLLFGDMLDALNSEPDTFSDRVGEISISFVIVAIINLFSGLFQVMCWSTTGERQSQKLREKYVQAVLSMEIGWFDTISPDELSTKVANLTGNVQDGLGRKSGDLIQYISQFISALVVGLYLSWKLTFVLLCSFPLIAFAGFYMITAVTDAQNNALSQYAAAGGLATESLSSIRTVTALNAQHDIISKYRVFLLDAMQVGIVKGFKVGLGNGGLFCACFLTYALGFWYGGKLVADGIDNGCVPNAKSHGCITGGTIIAVFFSVLMGSMALGQIAQPLTSFTGARNAVAHMFKVINRKSLIDGFSEDGLKPKEKTKGRIDIKDVQFAYPSRPNINICNGYNLSIEPGQLVALIGSSGCGKSTIINLLLRFYDPQSGSISIDGNIISDLNVRWLRSQIGYVSQEPVLFSGSVADNIAFGLDIEVSPNDDSAKEKAMVAIRARVIEAAKLANAHDFISNLPQGYDTDVGFNGDAISGGQKQRIAIARALVKQPSILLLDEATSALDANSERMVQQSIDTLQKLKTQTVIVIAHRLSTIRNADKIAVIDKGEVVEIGTHDELLKKNGLYADLVRLQMSGHEDDNHNEKQSDLEEYLEVIRKKSNFLKEKIEYDLKKDKEEILSKDESSELWWKIWDLIFKQPYWMIIGLAGSCVFGTIFPLWGILLAKTQNMFYYTDPDRIRRRALELSFVYIGLAFTSILSSTLQYWGVAQVGERVSMRLRSDMFESLMRREISYFDKEENSIGNLTTRLSDDSRIVCKASGKALAKQLQAFFTLIVGLTIGFSASWRIAGVVLATFPVNIASSSLQMKAYAGLQYDTEYGEGNNHGALISSAFTQMRTIIAFSMQTKVSSKYSTMTSIICQERSKKSIVAGLGFGGSQMTLFLTYALLFWYGSSLIEEESITFEQMMTGILPLMIGALGLGAALADLGDQQAGLLASKRIFKSVEEGKLSPIDGLMTDGIRPIERSKGKIEFKNINFSYPSRPDAIVCKNYNLTINAGEVVALVGPSGSGKSTIMNLLLRFYDPLDGIIELDGQDITSLNVRWLRSQIGYVGQEPVLFSGSVADNIKKGRANFANAALLTMDEAILVSDTKNYRYALKGPNYESFASAINNNNEDDNEDNFEDDIERGIINDDMAAILIASKSSNAHDFITSFPQGYDTDVGEGSIMVSGGQKQRIAIARALVKQPSILLLDEATSALDANSERMVQQSIDALQKLKTQTVIVIAHRLSTIRNADKIAVIDKGEVVEIGTHDELLKKNGLYTNLWSKQAGVEK